MRRHMCALRHLADACTDPARRATNTGDTTCYALRRHAALWARRSMTWACAAHRDKCVCVGCQLQSCDHNLLASPGNQHVAGQLSARGPAPVLHTTQRAMLCVSRHHAARLFSVALVSRVVMAALVSMGRMRAALVWWSLRRAYESARATDTIGMS